MIGTTKWMVMGAVLAAAAGAYAAETEPVPLFDGKTLNGWSVHSGFAKYRVEDGCIVGTTVEDSPNTFLCTDREFGDFDLEFDVQLMNTELNSGVQIRSEIAKTDKVFWFQNREGQPVANKIPKDRVHGYQVEIALQKAASAGRVYDEARRGFFLGEKSDAPEAATAFRDNDWNHYRIVCQGDSIKVWVNDIPCADFRDSMDARGVIGLQVHQIAKGAGPYEVKWKNIQLKELK